MSGVSRLLFARIQKDIESTNQKICKIVVKILIIIINKE